MDDRELKVTYWPKNPHIQKEEGEEEYADVIISIFK